MYPQIWTWKSHSRSSIWSHASRLPQLRRWCASRACEILLTWACAAGKMRRCAEDLDLKNWSREGQALTALWSHTSCVPHRKWRGDTRSCRKAAPRRAWRALLLSSPRRAIALAGRRAGRGRTPVLGYYP
eukprot:4827256-Pleurochrysis_carterae.AAC.3